MKAYDIYVIPPGEAHARFFDGYQREADALEAFNIIVSDGRVRAAFLDEVTYMRGTNKKEKRSLKTWRRRSKG